LIELMSAIPNISPARNDSLFRGLGVEDLASQASLNFGMSALELDGYLTGVLVAPDRIRPNRWIAAVWSEAAPVFDDANHAQYALSTVGLLFNSIGNRIDESLRHLEAERICDYRPAFLPSQGKASREAIRTWVRGFWKAMALAPWHWSALAADERTQPIIAPFVGFIDLDADGGIELAPDFDERLDEAADLIPRSILLLRKIADLRASRPSEPVQTRRTKVGRNDPCPCGSGGKFKRCCGAS
jgi:uncharacterized protein